MGFNLQVGATTLASVLNPALWTLTAVWFTVRPAFVQGLFPDWVFYPAMLCLIVGNFLAYYAGLVTVRASGRSELLRAALLMPVYWALMSLAAIRALLQILVSPFLWEKTVRGLDATVPEQGARHAGDRRARRPCRRPLRAEVLRRQSTATLCFLGCFALYLAAGAFVAFNGGADVLGGDGVSRVAIADRILFSGDPHWRPSASSGARSPIRPSPAGGAPADLALPGDRRLRRQHHLRPLHGRGGGPGARAAGGLGVGRRCNGC